MQDSYPKETKPSVHAKGGPIRVLWEPSANFEGGDQLRKAFEIIFGEELLSLDLYAFDENRFGRHYEVGAERGFGPTKGRLPNAK